MFCPRLEHFVRLNQNGTIGKCGHMVKAKGLKHLTNYITVNGLKKYKWI